MSKLTSILITSVFLFNSTFMFAQANTDPKLDVAFKTLEQVETDVASSIIKTTSVLHRLEKALMIDKLYQKAVEVPSLVYIGTSGVAFGGLVFILGGGAVNTMGKSAKGTGNSLQAIEHRAASVENFFNKSGQSSINAAPSFEKTGEFIMRFGRSWWNLSKVIVNNKFSQKSSEAFLNYIVKPARKVINYTAEKSSAGVEHSFNGLKAVGTFLSHNIIGFGKDTAVGSGVSIAVTTMLAAAGALSYTSWKRGKNLYSEKVYLTDEKIQAIVLNDEVVVDAIEKVSNNLTVFFNLSLEQKSKLKEVIANDLLKQKLLEYRAKLKESNKVSSVRKDYKSALKSNYNLTQEEIEEKLRLFDEQLTISSKRLEDNAEKELKDYDLLKSVAKVMNKHQLAALSAISSVYDVKEAINSINKSIKLQSTNEVLTEIDDQIKVLEILKAYIAQAMDFKDVFNADAIQEVETLIIELEEKIELRKQQLELIK